MVFRTNRQCFIFTRPSRPSYLREPGQHYKIHTVWKQIPQHKFRMDAFYLTIPLCLTRICGPIVLVASPFGYFSNLLHLLPYHRDPLYSTGQPQPVTVNDFIPVKACFIYSNAPPQLDYARTIFKLGRSLMLETPDSDIDTFVSWIKFSSTFSTPFCPPTANP